MRRASLAALTLAGTATIHAASAQDLSNSSLTARISQSFEFDTNYDLDDPSPGDSYFGDTRFALDYLQEGSTQSFALGLDTGLRSLWRADEDFEFVVASPSLGYLTYSQEGVDTLFDADFRVRSRQVDTSSLVEEFVSDEGVLPDDLNEIERDTRELRYDADIGFALGTSSPSTYEFRVLATAFTYADEDDTDLVPRRSVEGNALWTLRLTPVLSSAVFGSYFYYTADDAAETELRIAEVDAGVVYEPNEVLRVRGGLGYADRNRESRATGATIDDEAGPTIRGDIRYLLPDFTLIGDARVTAAAPDTRFSGNLRAVYTLPRGQVVGRIFQRYTAGTGGDESRVTGAGIGILRDVNAVSRIGLDFAYATQVNEDDPDEPDIDRTDFTARYIYDFTAAISTEVGYQFRNRIEDPEDADSHRLFFSIGRTFVTGL